MFDKEKIRLIVHYIMQGLPLAAILVASALPLPANTRPWLIAAALVWFQIFIIFEVFGK